MCGCWVTLSVTHQRSLCHRHSNSHVPLYIHSFLNFSFLLSLLPFLFSFFSSLFSLCQSHSTSHVPLYIHSFLLRFSLFSCHFSLFSFPFSLLSFLFVHDSALVTCSLHLQTRHLVSLSEELFGSWLLIYFSICQLNQYMSHSQMLGKFEYGGGPIFKVVLEC